MLPRRWWIFQSRVISSDAKRPPVSPVAVSLYGLLRPGAKARFCSFYLKALTAEASLSQMSKTV
jgi:hypothetical protein